MRFFIVVFIALSAGIALVQYHSTITWIAQLMGISWGALSGAFIGPYLWGLYSGKISKASVWTSFIFAVCLTTGNMLIGLAGLTPALQGAVAGIPIISWVFANGLNCGAFAMMASIVIVPLVSLFTKAVPFDVNPPAPESATDREIGQKIGTDLGKPAEALIDA